MKEKQVRRLNEMSNQVSSVDSSGVGLARLSSSVGSALTSLP